MSLYPGPEAIKLTKNLQINLIRNFLKTLFTYLGIFEDLITFIKKGGKYKSTFEVTAKSSQDPNPHGSAVV
jgi:hypothetical protein